MTLDQKNWDSRSRDLRTTHGASQENFRAWSYGNLESLLHLASAITKDEQEFHRAIDGLSAERIKEYLEVSNAALLEVDRLVPWVQGNSRALWDLRQMRVLILVLRDELERASGNQRLADPVQRDFQFRGNLNQVLKIVVEQIERDFRERRKLVDQMTRISYSMRTLFLVLSLLWILPGRPILIGIAKLRKRPYTDPWSPSVFPEQLRVWREAKGFDEQQAARVLGWSVKKYRYFEMGYERPLEIEEMMKIFTAINMLNEQVKTGN